MIALDTNVLLRFLVEDEQTPAHSAAARAAVSAAIQREEQIFVPITVLAEVVWLLVHVVKVGKDRTAETLDVLMSSSEIVLDQRGAVSRASMRWRNGPADFNDYLSYELAMGAGASALLSFDRKLLRTPAVIQPE